MLVEKRVAGIIRWLERLNQSYSSGALESALMDAECARADLENLRRAVWEKVKPAPAKPKITARIKKALIPLSIAVIAVFGAEAKIAQDIVPSVLASDVGSSQNLAANAKSMLMTEENSPVITSRAQVAGGNAEDVQAIAENTFAVDASQVLNTEGVLAINESTFAVGAENPSAVVASQVLAAGGNAEGVQAINENISAVSSAQSRVAGAENTPALGSAQAIVANTEKKPIPAKSVQEKKSLRKASQQAPQPKRRPANVESAKSKPAKTVAYDKVFSLMQTGQRALKNNNSVVKVK